MDSKSSIPKSQASKALVLTLAIVLLACVAVFAGVSFANAQDAVNESTTDEVAIQDADLATKTSKRVEMYRIYNPWTGEHLYTSNVEERDSNVKLGWHDEGTEWIAPVTSSIKVYRLYNPFVTGGDHHYTTDEKEYNSLEKQGWKKEGIAWYGADKNESGTVALLRQYNPFGVTGTHNYTKNEKEQTNLVSLGWKAEGIGWYGYESLYIDISKMTAKVSTVGTTYTGKQLTPTVSIAGLTAGTDYTVTYGKNINAGKNAGTATIKGKGAYTGTITVKFDIQKANPTFAVPKNLTGVQKSKLSTVTIPAATNGTFKWKSSTTLMSKQGTQKFDATFTPKDTKNYNTVSTQISVYVKGLYTVTFETGEGSIVDSQEVVEGEKATLPSPAPTLSDYSLAGWYTDSTYATAFDFSTVAIKGDTKIYAKWAPYVKFDVQNHGTKVADKASDSEGKVEDPTYEAGKQEGLEIEGWYTDAKCSTDAKWDFDKKTVDKPMTLYANWVPASDGDAVKYWIAPAMKTSTDNVTDKVGVANENYVKEAWNVKKSSEEIQDDIIKINQGDTETINEYKSFMTNDNYHLYTAWKGTSSSETNQYVECRIINVGSHKAFSTDSTDDGSVLTFQATHIVTTAVMNAGDNGDGTKTAITKNGWKGSDLYTSMNSGDTTATIFGSFNTGFTDDLIGVQKTSTVQFGSTDIQYCDNKLWILDESEVSAAATRYGTGDTPYDFYKNLGTVIADASQNNPILKQTFRDGTSDTKTASCWSRSATASFDTDGFWRVLGGADGNCGYGVVTPYSEIGVVPAFSLGVKRTVKFDNQGHGNTIKEQRLSDDQTTATQPTTSEVGTADGLTLEGWYTDEKCSEGNKFNFSTEITQLTKLYANWVPAEDGDALKYWIAPAMKTTTGNTEDKVDQANSNYVKEEWNVKKSSKEIQADVAKIIQGDTATISEYKKYMTDDTYHLYTKWNGTRTDSSHTDEAKNAYVEFRIVDVGANYSSEGLTFQATHTLPTSYQMNSTNDESILWSGTGLYASLNNENGDVIKNFNKGFSDDLALTERVANLGPTLQRQGVVSYNKMWVASRYEMSGSDYAIKWPSSSDAKYFYRDGSKRQFQYYSPLNISDTGYTDSTTNLALKRKTRAGYTPLGVTTTDSDTWWTMSNSHPSNLGYEANNIGTTGSLTVATPFVRYSGVVPCFSFGGNAVTFNTQGHGNAVDSQAVSSGTLAKDPTSQTSETGLKLEGWYTDAKCTPANRWDFSKNTVTKATTLYANWVPSDEADGDENNFWLSPSVTTTTASATAAANENYVTEKWNVKKSSAEILADVAKIKANDEATIAEYTEYMNNDTFHLYTKWNGSDAGDTSGKNALAEFRIIGVGSHDGDNTGLTFQAVHVLPAAYQMHTEASSNISWGATGLHKDMFDGNIFSKFQTGLTSHIATVTKKTTKGGGTLADPVTATEDSTNKFWLASRSEISGATKATKYNVEGTQYDYYKALAIDDGADATNTKLLKVTRAGNNPAVATGDTLQAGCWWMRSPNTEDGATFLAVSATGCLNSGFNINSNYAGVVPCFCL